MVWRGKRKFHPTATCAHSVKNQKLADGSTEVTSKPASTEERTEVIAEIEPLNNIDRICDKLSPEVSFQTDSNEESFSSSENKILNEINFPVPKLMIDSNGDVIIDESSLYLVQILPELGEAVQEADIYPKRRITPIWSKSDTKVFYEALRYIGPNFPILALVLKRWTEAEIKAKYKRELKQRSDYVFDILRSLHDLNVEVIKQKVSTSDKKASSRAFQIS